MARMQNVSIKDMDIAIKDILETYGDKATKIVREESSELGKKAVKELKSTSPKNKGDYRKGWTSQTKKTWAGAETVVYNKDRYQLTHLLENGHYLRNGAFWTPKEKHIAPVSEEIQKEFIENIEKRLK